MRHHEYNYLFIWFSFWFHFQNRCGVHNSWLTASCQCYVLCFRIVRVNVVLLAVYCHCLVHNSICLWRWKHSRISIMSLFSKGEIRLANACRVRSISIPITAFPLRCVCGSAVRHIVAHNTTANSVNSICEYTFRFLRMQIANEFTFSGSANGNWNDWRRQRIEFFVWSCRKVNASLDGKKYRYWKNRTRP